jgi:hypothetical protein
MHVDNGVYICPQAWFLGRCDVPVSPEVRVRLEAGTRAHRRIGRRTDQIRTMETIRLWLLMIMAGLIAVAALVALRGGS